MTQVELRGLVQSFDGHLVLRRLDLSIHSGHYVVLLGPSGCGKSTTLRIIAGIQQPDEGDVRLDGRSVVAVAPDRRDVAMVFQQDGLYPHLTVRQSIAFSLRRTLRPKDAEARTIEAARIAGVKGVLDRLPQQLSGGERRRAALAKAIARRPSLRLLDEPLSALDVAIRHQLQNDIVRWHTSTPGTTLHVTHDGQEAMRLADRIAVMDQGQIVQYDTPTEVYARPKTFAAAQALGRMPLNRFALQRSRLRREGLRSDDGELQVWYPQALFTEEGPESLLVVVRPESFRVDVQAESPTPPVDRLVVRGVVSHIHSLHDTLLVYLAHRDETVCAVATDAAVRSVESGQTVTLTASISDLHCYDAETNQRSDSHATPPRFND